MLEHLLSLIAPHVCIGCQKEGELLCGECEGLLRQAPDCCYRCAKQGCLRVCRACQPLTALQDLRAAVLYQSQAKELVHRLKYKRAGAAARCMARIMTPGLSHVREAVIVPIPTATGRVRRRGYDQSALIARELARQLALPYKPLLLRDGQSRQVGQKRLERKMQLQNAFRLRSGVSLAAQHYLLIDDVLTTGSTIEAAAGVLKTAGVAKITAAVFAVRMK